jgi:hypothetical protein
VLNLSKPSKFLSRALILPLVLSFSGTLPVIRTALANDARTDFRALSQQGLDLDEEIKLQVRRARHPGTPGTPDGIPTAGDVSQLEASLLKWKSEIERVLTLPDSPSAAGAEFLPIDGKLRAINSYLNVLTSLATLRIALGLPHALSWSDGFALQVRKALVAEMPGLGTLTTNRMGDRFMPMVIDRGADNQTDPVRLKISASLVQGLELGRLADQPDDDTNLTMLKYLAVRQLISNLADLRYIKRDHDVSIPEIPAPLKAKLDSMGMAQVIAEEQRRAVAEPGARAALLERYAAIADEIQTYVDDELVTELANIIGKDDRKRLAARGPLKEALTESERNNLRESLAQEFNASSAPFSALGARDLDDALASIVANAKANCALKEIMELMGKGVLGDLTSEQRHRIMDRLDSRKESYVAGLEPKTIRRWESEARRATEELLYSSQRIRFIDNVLVHAPEAVKSLQHAYSGETVDPEILSETLQGDLAKLAPSNDAKDEMITITRAGSYLSARGKYAEIVAHDSDSSTVADGTVDPEKIETFLAHHSLAPYLPKPPHTSAERIARIENRIGAVKRSDLRALVKWGEWMGFHRKYSSGNPSLREVVTDKRRADQYVQKLEASVETQYPILGIKVQDGIRLANALTDINPHFESSPQIEDQAQHLIDQALVRIESQVRRNIDKVGSARSGAEIEKVVTSSMMLALVMKGFPEFHLYEDQFIQELLSPSATDQVMRRYVGPYMAYGFGAIMLMHGTNWVAKQGAKRLGWGFLKDAFPVTNVLTWGLDSVLAGYMRSAMIVILADTAYNAYGLYRERQQRQQIQDFSSCSADGPCFFDAEELAAANSAYSVAKWSFFGRMAMDTGLMYLPMGISLVHQFGDRLVMAEFMADTQAFERLGLRPSEFEKVERNMELARSIREGHADVHIVKNAGADVAHLAEFAERLVKMSAENWAELERSYARLSAKIKAGQTYRLPTVIDRLAIQDAFKSLDLSPKKPASWDKIEEARALHSRAAPTRGTEGKVNRAARFLKSYLLADPGVRTREFKLPSLPERKLLKALGRNGMIEKVWDDFARAEIHGMDTGPANDDGSAPKGGWVN